MGIAVNFDPNAFLTRYPEFSQLTSDLLQAYFNEATLYHKNDGSGPINIPSTQSMLLNMVTAHIAELNKADSNGNQVSSLVGRIASASEGSVSVSSEMDAPQSAAWWMQTKYGAAYWNATKAYRTMRYLPGRPRNMNPPFLFGRGGY